MKLWYNDVRMKPKGVILMSEQLKMLINTAEGMTDKQIKEVVSFAKYIKYKAEDIEDGPEELIVKDDEDFIQKIKDGMEDSEEMTFEEAAKRMDEKIMLQRGN